VESSCDYSNESSGSVKYWEILEQLSEWCLLQKGLSSMELASYVVSGGRYTSSALPHVSSHKILGSFLHNNIVMMLCEITVAQFAGR
jgi:hypothetical protein